MSKNGMVKKETPRSHKIYNTAHLADFPMETLVHTNSTRSHILLHHHVFKNKFYKFDRLSLLFHFMSHSLVVRHEMVHLI